MFMRAARLACVCVLAAVALIAAPAQAADDQPLNLLFFGNSFTILPGPSSGQRVPDNIRLLAIADGYAAPLIVADLEGSTELDRHISRVQNSPTSNVNHPDIAGKTWDYVIAQGHSRESSRLGDSADFIADALTLHNLIRNHASGRGAGVNTILYQTWAYYGSHSIYNGANPSFDSPAEMHAEVRANYALAAAGINAVDPGAARIAPVGDAFAERDFARSLYSGDYYHSSEAGALLASMVIYRTIYDELVGDIPFSAVSAWSPVNESFWNSLVATADSITIVPEPGTASVLGVLMAGLLLRRRP